MAVASGTVRELEEKEVINLCDGSLLGYCTDLEIDLVCASIVALHVRKNEGWFSFRRTEPIRIPWNRIERIGDDTILVRLSETETGNACACPKKP